MPTPCQVCVDSLHTSGTVAGRASSVPGTVPSLTSAVWGDKNANPSSWPCITLGVFSGHPSRHMSQCTAEKQGDCPDLKVAEVRFRSSSMRPQMQGCGARCRDVGPDARVPCLKAGPFKWEAPSLGSTSTVQPLPTGAYPQGLSYVISVSLGLSQAGKPCPASLIPSLSV